jgi:hypothetical protein
MLNELRYHIYVLSVAVFLLASVIGFYLLGSDVVGFLTVEDGWVESLSAACYLVAFVYLLKERGFSGSLFSRLWLLLLFIFFGEEISWFQRVFDWSWEGLQSNNAQGEINFHNLSFFSGKGLADANGVNLSFSSLLSSQNLFRLGLWGYFFVLPVLYFGGALRRFLKSQGYVYSGVVFFVSMWSVIGCSYFLAYGSPAMLKHDLAELRELIFSVFIALYIVKLVKCPALILSKERGGISVGSDGVTYAG